MTLVQVPLIPLRSSPERWISFYNMQKGSFTLRFHVVHVHMRRGDLKNVLGQILGDVQ